VAAFNYLQRRVAALLSGADVLSNLVLATERAHMKAGDNEGMSRASTSRRSST